MTLLNQASWIRKELKSNGGLGELHTHIWSLRPKIDPRSRTADSVEFIASSLHSLFASPTRSSQPVEGLDPLTSWSQTHFLPASFPNLISAASALHKCQRVVCYIMSWTEKRGPLRGNRKCFIVKASSVYKNSCIWMAQVQNIHSAKNAIQASRGANWARPTVFCFGMELFIPLMIRIRAGWEQNCVL